MSVSIVIPTYNRKKELKICIESIIEQAKTNNLNIEIIICDGNSTDGTEKIVENIIKENKTIDFKYLKSNKIVGPGENRNRGCKEATYEIVGFIDDDCFYSDKYSLEVIFKSFQEEEKIDIIRFKVEVDGKNNISLFSHQPSINDFGENDYGGIFFIKKKKFEELNGFQSIFFDTNKKIHFREDTDFFYRAMDMKMRILYIDKSLVIHPVYSGTWKWPFKEISRLRYDLAFNKKWKNKLNDGKIILGIRVRMKNIRFVLSIIQILAIILSVVSMKKIYFNLYILFHFLHLYTYLAYSRRFIYKELIVMSIELLIIPFYRVYIEILGYKFYVKSRGN